MKTLNCVPNKYATSNLCFLISLMLKQESRISVDGFYSGFCLSEDSTEAELIVTATMEISLAEICAALRSDSSTIQFLPYSAKITDYTGFLVVEVDYAPEDIHKKEYVKLTCTLDVSNYNPQGKLPARPASVVSDLIDDLENALYMEYPVLPAFNHGLTFGLRIADLHKGTMITYVNNQRNRIRTKAKISRINSHVFHWTKCADKPPINSPLVVVEFKSQYSKFESAAICIGQIVEISK